MASTAIRGADCVALLGIVAADNLTPLVGTADSADTMRKIGFTALAVNDIGNSHVIVGATHALAGLGSFLFGNCHDVYLFNL